MGSVTLLSGASFNAETGFSQPPALIDLAVGQGRQARFVGQTNHWWSVLHHVYAGYYILRAEGKRLRSPTMLNWFMHDAHEAITSDIPSPICSPDMRALQSKIDAEMWAAFNIPRANRAQDNLKQLDRSLLVAEAYALCPPAAPDVFLARFGEEADQDKVRVVAAVQGMFATAASSADGWGSFLVRWWVGRMRGMLGLPGGWQGSDEEDLYLVEKMMNKQSITYGGLYDEADDE